MGGIDFGDIDTSSLGIDFTSDNIDLFGLLSGLGIGPSSFLIDGAFQVTYDANGNIDLGALFNQFNLDLSGFNLPGFNVNLGPDGSCSLIDLFGALNINLGTDMNID